MEVLRIPSCFSIRIHHAPLAAREQIWPRDKQSLVEHLGGADEVQLSIFWSVLFPPITICLVLLFVIVFVGVLFCLTQQKQLFKLWTLKAGYTGEVVPCSRIM